MIKLIKNSKYLSIKMLTEIKGKMHEQSEISMKGQKIKKLWNRNHVAKEHNNWSENFIMGIQQQIRSNIRKDQWTQRQISGNNLVRGVKRQKNEKEWR